MSIDHSQPRRDFQIADAAVWKWNRVKRLRRAFLYLATHRDSRRPDDRELQQVRQNQKRWCKDASIPSMNEYRLANEIVDLILDNIYDEYNKGINDHHTFSLRRAREIALSLLCRDDV